MNNFRYTAREWDSETDLYYYRARYYDQSTGRFFGEDPLQFDAGDINFYRYVGNDPTDWTDLFGLKPGDKYPSMDCAARNAINDIFPLTKQDGLEHGGFLYQNSDGTYSYSDPITGGPTYIPRGPFYAIPTPNGSSRSGWYHTHPSVPGYRGGDFSPGDAGISNHLDGTGLNYPNPLRGAGYLGTPLGTIRKYVPIVDPALGPGPHVKPVAMKKDPCGCK